MSKPSVDSIKRQLADRSRKTAKIKKARKDAEYKGSLQELMFEGETAPVGRKNLFMGNGKMIDPTTKYGKLYNTPPILRKKLGLVED